MFNKGDLVRGKEGTHEEYDHFNEYTVAEVMTKPDDGVVLVEIRTHDSGDTSSVGEEEYVEMSDLVMEHPATNASYAVGAATSQTTYVGTSTSKRNLILTGTI